MTAGMTLFDEVGSGLDWGRAGKPDSAALFKRSVDPQGKQSVTKSQAGLTMSSDLFPATRKVERSVLSRPTFSADRLVDNDGSEQARSRSAGLFASSRFELSASPGAEAVTRAATRTGLFADVGKSVSSLQWPRLCSPSMDSVGPSLPSVRRVAPREFKASFHRKGADSSQTATSHLKWPQGGASGLTVDMSFSPVSRSEEDRNGGTGSSATLFVDASRSHTTVQARPAIKGMGLFADEDRSSRRTEHDLFPVGARGRGSAGSARTSNLKMAARRATRADGLFDGIADHRRPGEPQTVSIPKRTKRRVSLLLRRTGSGLKRRRIRLVSQV
ncbi:hypothetical protein ACVILH_004235 [Bradyrhizobium sp. USDA 4353]